MAPHRAFVQVAAMAFAILGALGPPGGLDGAAAKTPGVPVGCDPELIAASRALPNAYDSQAAYCDGTVALPNGGELQLVSATIGKVIYSESGHSLVVQRPDLGALGDPLIRGQDMRAGGHYRLDGVLHASGLIIDLQHAAIPNGITSRAFGLLGWFNEGGDTLYAPVLAGGKAKDDVRLVFRADQATIRVGRRFCENGACEPQALIAKNVPDGGLIEIVMPRGAAARRVDIKIVTLRSGGIPGGHVYHLIVPGR